MNDGLNKQRRQTQSKDRLRQGSYPRRWESYTTADSVAGTPNEGLERELDSLFMRLVDGPVRWYPHMNAGGSGPSHFSPKRSRASLRNVPVEKSTSSLLSGRPTQTCISGRCPAATAALLSGDPGVQTYEKCVGLIPSSSAGGTILHCMVPACRTGRSPACVNIFIVTWPQ